MSQRNHLKRLPSNRYCDDSIVHWTLTIRNRKTGWLSSEFHFRFRECLTHTLFRYGLVCPVYCLMPDHMHLIWLGTQSGCNQLNAMKHFRPRVGSLLQQVDSPLQDQAFDHVLTADERKELEFRRICEYVVRNPERAKLVERDRYAEYDFSGAIVPGYPELELFAEDFWRQFDRVVSFLRKSGFQRLES